MARRIKLLGAPPASVKEAIDNDLAAAKTQAAGDDDTVAAGRGSKIITLVDNTKCVSFYLSASFIKSFDIVQPEIGTAQFFTVEQTIDTTNTEETTRNTRAKKTRAKTTDLSKVSYKKIKIATDGLVTRPTRTYRGVAQPLKYISARFPPVLTSDCINWFIVHAFGGGAETERRLPTHFLYDGSEARVDVVSPFPSTNLASYNV